MRDGGVFGCRNCNRIVDNAGQLFQDMQSSLPKPELISSPVANGTSIAAAIRIDCIERLGLSTSFSDRVVLEFIIINLLLFNNYLGG